MGKSYKALPDRLDGMMPLTLDVARYLGNGTWIYHATKCNADGSAMRARITSIKTWKRDSTRIEIGYKHGLYDTGKLNASDLSDFMVDARDYESATMRMHGFVQHSYRKMVTMASLEGSPMQGHTWIEGWYSPINHVQIIGDITINAPLSTACSVCGTERASLANSLNPYPKMCPCGVWFDPSF